MTGYLHPSDKYRNYLTREAPVTEYMMVLKLPNISLDELTVIEEKRVTYNLNEPVQILPNESRIPVVQEDHKAIILQCRATIFWDSKYLTYFMNACQ